MFAKSSTKQKKHPVCLRNPSYSSAFEKFKHILLRYPESPLQALLVGSGHRKRNPPDADILIVNMPIHPENAPTLSSTVLALSPISEVMQFVANNIANFNQLSGATSLALGSQHLFQEEVNQLALQLQQKEQNHLLAIYHLQQQKNTESLPTQFILLKDHYAQEFRTLSQQIVFLQQQIAHCHFYNSLPENSLLRILADMCFAGASITEAYRKNKRAIIKIRMEDAVLELNLEYPSLQAHEAVSDFTINTLYYDIKNSLYISASELAFSDIRNKILRSTRDNIYQMFKEDITIFFRALRIIGSEKYTAEPELLKAMQDLPHTLPAAISEMNPDRLILDKCTLLCSGYAVNIINFIEKHALLNYLFPKNYHEIDEDSRKKLFLFKKIAEVSDALFLNDISHTSYPHDISRYMQSIEKLKLEDRKKMMLCFFDYALHHAIFLTQGLSAEKYTIYQHKNSKGFYSLENHISKIEELGRDLLSLHLTNYKELPEETHDALETQELIQRTYSNIETQSDCTDKETTEEELSEPENFTQEKVKDNILNLQILGSTFSVESEKIVSDIDNRAMQKDATLETETQIERKEEDKDCKNQSRSSKKKQRKKSQKKKDIHQENIQHENCAAYNKDEYLTSYNSGLQNLEIYELALALNLLTQAAISQTYRDKILTEANNVKEKLPLKESELSEKTCLKTAILFDSIGEENSAICYYRNFLHYHAEANIIGPSANSTTFIDDTSFIYLRLFILSHSFSKRSTQRPVILDHEKPVLETLNSHLENVSKYYEEINLNPTINEDTKAQARDYSNQENIKQNDKDINSAPLSPSAQSISAGKDYMLGLYFSAMLGFTRTVEIFTEPRIGIKSGIKAHLLASVLYCCIQLKLYTESVNYLEAINREDGGEFINDEKNASIIDNIFFEIGKYTCTDKLNEYCNGMELLGRIMHLRSDWNLLIKFYKEALKELSHSGLNAIQKENINNRKAFLYFKIIESYYCITQKSLKHNEALAKNSVEKILAYQKKYSACEKISPIIAERVNSLNSKILIIKNILERLHDQKIAATLNQCHATHFSTPVMAQDKPFTSPRVSHPSNS